MKQNHFQLNKKENCNYRATQVKDEKREGLRKLSAKNECVH